MLNIIFNPDFDFGYWPGPLTQKEAVAGEIWIGQSGFLSFLETRLGLRRRFDPDNVRAAALVPEVLGQTGFWSQSAQVDPFGTAKKLLQWRDKLWLHGWRGQGVSPKLNSLHQVTSKVSPGVPDRLIHVAEAINKLATDIDTITLFESEDALPHAWKQILRNLSRAGVNVVKKQTPPVNTSGDLAAAGKPAFTPNGDGSIQFIQPIGPMTAAHEIAAWLADKPDLYQTVIIGHDLVLDEALQRFGLPITGAIGSATDNLLLQILPLILSLAWWPPDPERAIELLSLPISPIPRGLARKLVSALQETPAVDSDDWRHTVAVYLESMDGKDARLRLSDRLAGIFEARISNKYPIKEIRSRVALINQWARGRVQKQNESEEPWSALFSQLDNFQRLVDLSSLQEFSAAQVRRLIQDATTDVSLPAPNEAQAGLTVVGRPGCIRGPAQRIVWWSFSNDSVESVMGLPLSTSERQALTKEGIEIPYSGEEGIVQASRWHQPLISCREELLLVCPRKGSDGQDLYPHPLWAEIEGNMAKSADPDKIIGTSPLACAGIKKRKRTQLPLPQAITQVKVAKGVIGRRSEESATSLETLIACPFQYVVKYFGRIYNRGISALSQVKNLEGAIVHQILEQLLANPPRNPEQAQIEAEKLLAEQGPRLAAQIFLPGHEALKEQIRLAVAQVAYDVISIINNGKFKIKCVETEHSAAFPKLNCVLKGTPDLVLENPTVIIDFKRSGAKYRREQLTNGSYVQLAVYGQLVKSVRDDSILPLAYYILKDRRLLSTNVEAFPNVEVVDGPSADEVWAATEKTLLNHWKELKSGLVSAPGNDLDMENVSSGCQTNGCLIVTPSCNYCDYSLICGYDLLEQS
jgi:ATP-dependent helicase/nuclease subunit B